MSVVRRPLDYAATLEALVHAGSRCIRYRPMLLTDLETQNRVDLRPTRKHREQGKFACLKRACRIRQSRARGWD